MVTYEMFDTKLYYFLKNQHIVTPYESIIYIPFFKKGWFCPNMRKIGTPKSTGQFSTILQRLHSPRKMDPKMGCVLQFSDSPTLNCFHTYMVPPSDVNVGL